jgi:hypothetical protein
MLRVAESEDEKILRIRTLDLVGQIGFRILASMTLIL